MSIDPVAVPELHFQVAIDPPRIVATDAGGRDTTLSPVWLRELVEDPDQLDAVTRQRLFDPHQVARDLHLLAVTALGSARFHVRFSDGCSGTVDLGRMPALMAPDNRLPARVAWTGGEPAPPSLPFDPDDGSALLAAVHAYLTFGYVVLHDVGTQPEGIVRVAQTFGTIRETNFGPVFEVRTAPGSNDLAYRAVALGPHTDNPYREPVPGIQLLHCLVNETSGGLSTLVDSLAVIEALAVEDPAAVAILRQTPVLFRFTDASTDLSEWRPIIASNDRGDIVGVHYSPRLDHGPILDAADYGRFHAARYRLAQLLADPAFERRFRLQPGSLMMFDNRRLLHGRTSFDPNEGRRHLRGCYIDNDGPRSLYRVLSQRLGAC